MNQPAAAAAAVVLDVEVDIVIVSACFFSRLFLFLLVVLSIIYDRAILVV